jgi:hypothetical protein
MVVVIDNAEPIPDRDVCLEYLQAEQRTGTTLALAKARVRLPVLLSLKPETVEAYLKSKDAV